VACTAGADSNELIARHAARTRGDESPRSLSGIMTRRAPYGQRPFGMPAPLSDARVVVAARHTIGCADDPGSRDL
jgi:hypothetical protein